MSVEEDVRMQAGQSDRAPSPESRRLDQVRRCLLPEGMQPGFDGRPYGSGTTDWCGVTPLRF